MEMKVVLGFNDIRPDGMGSAAMTLMRALRGQGISVVPIHAWRHVEIPEYIEEFSPIFLSDEEDPPIGRIARKMVEAVNAVPGATHFTFFGAPQWGTIVPYLRQDLPIVESVHNINPSTIKLGRAYHKRIAAYVCVSEGVAERMRRALPKRERYKVNCVANAVAMPEVAKTDYALKDGVLRLLYLGRIENQGKGCGKIPLIVEQARRRGYKVELDLYGWFHGPYEPQFSRQCQKHGVSDYIHHRGVLSPQQVYDTIRNYDALLMPSNFEGFGLSLVEAMAVGLPVIVSDLKGITSWIVQSGKSGICVHKDDIGAFADGIAKLVDGGDSYRRSLGEGARARAREIASVESHGKAYASILEKTRTDFGCSVKAPEPLDAITTYPPCLQPWLLARILPPRVKAFLRRFMR